MSRFLLLNFKDFGLNQDITQYIQTQTLACICCLEKNVPFISLSTCKHGEFLNTFVKPALEPSMNVICFQCHALLKKIELFRKQVKASFDILKAETFSALESEMTKNINLEVKKTVNIYLPPAKYSVAQIKQSSKTAKEKKSQSIEKEVEKRKKQPVLPVQEIKSEPQDKMEIAVDTASVLKESSVSPEPFQKSPKLAQVSTTNQEKPNTVLENVKMITKENSVTKKSMTKAKVKTVKLTKEELMRERVKEAQSDTYLKMPYKCDYCLIGFTYEENIKDHMKRKHGPKLGSVTCDICLTVLHPPGSLTAHYYRHLTRYDCEQCGKRFANHDEAWNHYHKEHEILYKCTICDFSTHRLTKFRHHRYKHNKKCACKQCGVSLATRESLRKHMLVKHKKKRLWCVHCGARAPNARALAVHMRTHGADAARARCARCDVAFRSWNSYISHWMLSDAHLRDNTYSCEVCTVRFTTESALRAHTETEHDKVKCVCIQCDKIFSSTLDLEIHMKQHEKGSSISYFTCDYCDRNYTSRKQLTQHIEMHMKEMHNTTLKEGNSEAYKIQSVKMINRNLQGTVGNECSYKNLVLESSYNIIGAKSTENALDE